MTRRGTKTGRFEQRSIGCLQYIALESFSHQIDIGKCQRVHIVPRLTDSHNEGREYFLTIFVVLTNQSNQTWATWVNISCTNANWPSMSSWIFPQAIRGPELLNDNQHIVWCRPSVFRQLCYPVVLLSPKPLRPRSSSSLWITIDFPRIELIDPGRSCTIESSKLICTLPVGSDLKFEPTGVRTEWSYFNWLPYVSKITNVPPFDRIESTSVQHFWGKRGRYP